MRSDPVQALLLAALFVVVSTSCREPPSRGAEPAEGGAEEPGALVPPLGADELSADLTVELTRTWATGRSTRITFTREGSETEASVETVWRKSSLMQERTFEITVDGARLEKLLSVLRGAELPELVPDDGETPHCAVEVETPGRTWSTGGFCADLAGELLRVWKELTAVLHPHYFVARHLHEAGQHAESRLNARDVYFYYVDGAKMLGPGYGPLEGDHTGGQLEKAASEHEAEKYVEAVVAARNALATRLSLYERKHLEGMDIVPVSEPEKTCDSEPAGEEPDPGCGTEPGGE